ncbi:HNH endonuclease [Isoptericola sp. F-RaC21]|uniref:HNH endonuclease signature motif containing protein n=1 Tax=Isoptericola sp. F-RaC21 TaxID=3141452 RepID=UPI00315BD7E3
MRATVLERALAGLLGGDGPGDGRDERGRDERLGDRAARVRWAPDGATVDAAMLDVATLHAATLHAATPDTATLDTPTLDTPTLDGAAPRHGKLEAPARDDRAPAATARAGSAAGSLSDDPFDRPLLAVLDDAAPGPDLAGTLASLDEAELDDFTILEVLAAWERVAAWAQAGSARVLAEMLERTRGSSRHEFVADAVAARLGQTRHAAAQLVTVAHGTARLPEVADALAAGVVDRRKAEALIDAGRLPDPLRREVVAGVLPDAERLTVPQIRARMRRAEIEADPEGTEARHRAARAERFVRLEPVDDAMAYLTAYLPADDAARAFAVIDDAGLALRRAPGESRRLDECRADALTALVTGRLANGQLATGRPAAGGTAPGGDVDGPVSPSCRGARAGIRVTVAASTLLGSDDLPAILAGHGPIPPAMARALASDPDAVWQRLFTDPGSGVLTDLSPRSYRPSAALRAAVVARDVTCTFPGCRVPAASSDLDHVDPFDPASGAPQTHGDNLHALCRTHHRAKTVGGWQVARDPDDGRTTWIAPTGHRFARDPVPQDPRVTSRPPARPPGDRDGPPPF